MSKKKILLPILIVWGLVLLLTFGLSACQSQTPSQAPIVSKTEPIQPTGESQTDTSDPSSNTQQAAEDPNTIEVGWQTSSHADAFVVDATGQNNSCARCHAPVNWLPTMDDLPESCFTCKFELKTPPPYIPENEWADIPCIVCHKLNKDESVQPEIAWLEIAPLGEYAAVISPTELCMKCHNPVDIPGHGTIRLESAHADYECTHCHSAHNTTASCSADGCHSDVVDPMTPIPGHDEDHQMVSCIACHDGDDMVVGPDVEMGVWVTFATDTTGEEFVFASHNIVLDVECTRCHFVNNPWTLTENVEVP